MSDLNIPTLKKEPEKHEVKPEPAPAPVQAAQAPEPEPSPAPAKPKDPFENVFSHDIFWRHFNDALEPAHGVLMTLTQPPTQPTTQTGGIQNDTLASEPQSQSTPAPAEAGFITKYWPWMAIGGIGIVVIAFALSYFRKRRNDEGDDFRHHEPEPEPPPPPKRSTNPIDEYLPYGYNR